MSKKIRIYSDMICDLFHRGHVEFLKKISKLEKNSHIIIGIHSDKVAEAYKKRPVFSMKDRVEIIRSCRYVDEVIPDAPFLITENFLKLHKIDIVAHGDDMPDILTKENYPVPIKLGIMKIVPRWAGISTTDIIEIIKIKDKKCL